MLIDNKLRSAAANLVSDNAIRRDVGFVVDPRRLQASIAVRQTQTAILCEGLRVCLISATGQLGEFAES